MPMPSSSSAAIANCACCAAGSVGSSATSAARSPDGPSSRRYSKRRSRALRRSDRNSSASVDGSSIPSTPPRSNASSMKGCGSPGCRRAEVRSGSRLCVHSLGQNRKSGDAITTSALPPTADTPESGCDVRKVPTAEVDEPHSITSSARESIMDDISNPSAFAVLRLIRNSNFVGCSTGKSAAFAPFRSLST